RRRRAGRLRGRHRRRPLKGETGRAPPMGETSAAVDSARERRLSFTGMHSPVLRVLFVCTGNTCRSPMAAGALRKELGGEGAQVDPAWAGTAGWDGRPATSDAIEVGAGDGVDLGAHRWRRVTPAMVRAADLVLVMEKGQVGTVQGLGADPSRTHVLSEWPEP